VTWFFGRILLSTASKTVFSVIVLVLQLFLQFRNNGVFINVSKFPKIRPKTGEILNTTYGYTEIKRECKVWAKY